MFEPLANAPFVYNEQYENLTAEQYGNMDAYEVRAFQMYIILREYHEKMAGILSDDRKVSSTLRRLDKEG